MRKMDEMEIYIALKSVRIAWLYTVLFLFIWAGYDFLNTKELGLPFILLISQNIINYLASFYLKSNMSKYEE